MFHVYFFLRGLVHVFWRNIAMARFTYVGTCYANGEIIYPKEVTADGKSMKEAVRENLKKSIKSFERLGWTILFIALILNIPWIVLLYVLSKDLVFVPTN